MCISIYSVLRSSWYLRYGNITLQTVLLYIVVVPISRFRDWVVVVYMVTMHVCPFGYN